MKKKERNLNLDLIRSFAVFSVISVHFFLNNGYYETVIYGERMFLMTYIRTFFMICVPLFLLLTGYLTSKKVLNKEYYLGIKKILIIYLLASIMCLLYRIIFLDEVHSFLNIIKSLLNFSGAPYAWYINMYIGLFLLIPFLNLIYNNIKNKKQKLILIFTLIALSVTPCWWASIYPIAYYFIGAYLAEYGFKIPKIKNILLIVLSVLIFGTFNIYVSYNSTFVWGDFNGWGSLQNMLTSTLVFILLLNLKLDKLNNMFKKSIMKISELALGMYLISYIFDNYLYQMLIAKVDVMQLRLEWYMTMVLSVFILSLVYSQCITWIGDFILYIISKIKIPKNITIKIDNFFE